MKRTQNGIIKGKYNAEGIIYVGDYGETEYIL